MQRDSNRRQTASYTFCCAAIAGMTKLRVSGKTDAKATAGLIPPSGIKSGLLSSGTALMPGQG